MNRITEASHYLIFIHSLCSFFCQSPKNMRANARLGKLSSVGQTVWSIVKSKSSMERTRGLIYKTQRRFHPKTLHTHKHQNLFTWENIELYKTVWHTPHPTIIHKWPMLSSSWICWHFEGASGKDGYASCKKEGGLGGVGGAHLITEVEHCIDVLLGGGRVSAEKQNKQKETTWIKMWRKPRVGSEHGWKCRNERTHVWLVHADIYLPVSGPQMSLTGRDQEQKGEESRLRRKGRMTSAGLSLFVRPWFAQWPWRRPLTTPLWEGPAQGQVKVSLSF